MYGAGSCASASPGTRRRASSAIGPTSGCIRSRVSILSAGCSCFRSGTCRLRGARLPRVRALAGAAVPRRSAPSPLDATVGLTGCDSVLDRELVCSASHEGGGEQHASVACRLRGGELIAPAVAIGDHVEAVGGGRPGHRGVDPLLVGVVACEDERVPQVSPCGGGSPRRRPVFDQGRASGTSSSTNPSAPAHSKSAPRFSRFASSSPAQRSYRPSTPSNASQTRAPRRPPPPRGGVRLVDAGGEQLGGGGRLLAVGPEGSSVGGRLTLRAGLQPRSRKPPKRDRAEERSLRP